MNRIYAEVWNIDEHYIDTTKALAFVLDDAHGASALFLGTVRNRNQGRDVVAVSYDVFDKLAINLFQEICQEAMHKWGDDIKFYVVHTKGRLSVGDASIVIATASPHRSEAFNACRYVIEEIKHRAPIWKQEHYVDGDSEWVQGHALCNHG